METLVHIALGIVGFAVLWLFVLQPLFAFIDVVTKRKR